MKISIIITMYTVEMFHAWSLVNAVIVLFIFLFRLVMRIIIYITQDKIQHYIL